MLARARFADFAVLASTVLGMSAGLASAWLGWSAPSFSRWGGTVVTIVVGVAAGWSLIGAGASTWARTGDRSGALLVAAGGAWAISEWVNPQAAGSVVFTLGLVLGAVWPALLAHAGLDSSRSARRARVAVLGTAYVASLLFLGLVPALAFDPVASGCGLCPPNLIGALADPGLARTALRSGLALQILWTLVAAALLAREAAHRDTSAAIVRPVVRSTMALVLVVVAADAAFALSRGFKSNTTVDMVLWSIQAIGLIAIGADAAARALRARRARRSLARITLDLASEPRSGDLARALGHLLDDPSLQVVYPLDGGVLVDPAGRPADLAAIPGMVSTDVMRREVPVAHLVHRVGLLADEGRVADAVATTRLALENERLQALSQARVRELQASRSRIVSAADAERRRLERDLHDGAQQRMLGLAIELAIAREQGRGDGSGLEPSDDEFVEHEVRDALGDLRRLAHGIYPRTLADDGLGPALEELAEGASVPVDLLDVPELRLDATIEAAAYLVVALAIGQPGVSRAAVRARLLEDRLAIDVITNALQPTTVTDLEDRLGALDGSVTVEATGADMVRLHAEIPCES